MSGKNFPKRGEVYWVELEPAVGGESQKTGPVSLFPKRPFHLKKAGGPLIFSMIHLYNIGRQFLLAPNILIGGENLSA